MRHTLIALVGMTLIAAAASAQTRINPTDPQPTCAMCPGYYIPKSELEAFT